MMIDREARKLLFETVAQRVIASADELTDLDRAIGDGDHVVRDGPGSARTSVI